MPYYKWPGLEFRADKSRSIVIIKGLWTQHHFSVSLSSDLSVYSSLIPSIHTQPVKFLGCIIDGSLADRKSIEELEAKLLSGLKIIDGSYFSGTQKPWIIQHLLIPTIQWLLLIYEMSMFLAARLEQKISTFICKWLHLHHSMSNLCFYSADLSCPVPIKSLTSVLKSQQNQWSPFAKTLTRLACLQLPSQIEGWFLGGWESCEFDRTRH